jgi:hypothetical protein
MGQDLIMNHLPENQPMNKDESTPKIQSSSARWVQCKGYRCLAILGPNAKWRSFSTGEELKDIVQSVLE